MTADEQDLIRAYRMFFDSPAGLAIARDLMKFCKFRTPIASEKEEGMRQVFLRIINLAELSDEQLFALYAGRMIPQQERQDD